MTIHRYLPWYENANLTLRRIQAHQFRSELDLLLGMAWDDISAAKIRMCSLTVKSRLNDLLGPRLGLYRVSLEAPLAR